MKIVKSSVEILDNDWSIKGIFRAIEQAGRTCYKSVGTRYFRLEKGAENSLESNLIKQAQSDIRVVCKQGAVFDPAYYLSIPNKFISDYLNIEQFNEENFEDSPYYENLTAEDFVNMLIKSGHGAMLEHGTVYLYDTYDVSAIGSWANSLGCKYSKNKYSKVITDDHMDIRGIYITTNLRVLVENN